VKRERATSGRSALARAVLTTAAVTIALGAASVSRAQRVAVGRPLTLLVGSPSGEAVTERLDVARTNSSRSLLPTGSFRVIWSRTAHPTTHPPLVLGDGTVVVVGTEGDAVFFNPDGTDRARVSVGPGPTSAPTLLSDGTLVTVNGAGEAVGLRDGALAFRAQAVEPSARTTVADERPRPSPHVRPAMPRWPLGSNPPGRHPPTDSRDPAISTHARVLPLDDGGFVVALDHELVCLDAQGAIRSRATAPATAASPLLAAAQGVAFVSDGGAAYSWDLRPSADPVRLRGSFGGVVDGAVAALDDRHLLAVVDGARLVSLDLITGDTESRATATGGAFTGAFALTPAPGMALLQEATLSGTRVLAVDREGHATPFAIPLTTVGSHVGTDAGSPLQTVPTRTELFADPTGAVAYATVDGHVGVASATTKVELGFLPCGAPQSPSAAYVQRIRQSAGFAGLVPAGPHAFVVACESGKVSLIRGSAD
jgi:hypothetical protein